MFKQFLNYAANAIGYKSSGDGTRLALLDRLLQHQIHVYVSPEQALQVPAFYAGVMYLAQTLAMLPTILYQRVEEDDRRRASEKRLYRVLHTQANEELTAYEFKLASFLNVFLYGHSAAWIRRNSLGECIGLDLLDAKQFVIDDSDPWNVKYKYPNDRGVLIERPRNSLFILRGPSETGGKGRSLYQQARTALAFLVAAERFGTQFFANAAVPSLILVHPDELGKEGIDNIKHSVETNYSGQNAGRVLVLEEGVDIKEIQVPNDKAQLNELRTFQIQEIARVCRVTPHKLQELSRGTFSNIQELNQSAVLDSLQPWATLFEQAVYRDILTPKEKEEFYAEFQFDALLRGNLLQRMQTYDIAIRNAILNPNEARRLENMNKTPHGDNYVIPANMQGVDNINN